MHALWNQGDQYTDPDEQTINLTGAQGIHVIGLTEIASSESSSFGASVSFNAAAGLSGASLNSSTSQSNSTQVTQGSIDSDGGRVSFTTGEGSDLVIAGATVNTGTVEYDVGGDVVINSLQNTEQTESRGFGASVSLTGGANSLSANESRSEVIEQSGIYSTSGASGRIGGDIVLNGGAMVDEAGNSTLQLGGSVIDSNLSNSATVERQGMSLGFGGESGIPSLSPPTKTDNATDSTIYAVTSGIAFTRPDGSTVDLRDVRSEIEGANVILADANEQDHNVLAIFATTIAAITLQEYTANAIGDAYANGNLNSWTHKLAHGVSG